MARMVLTPQWEELINRVGNGVGEVIAGPMPKSKAKQLANLFWRLRQWLRDDPQQQDLAQTADMIIVKYDESGGDNGWLVRFTHVDDSWQSLAIMEALKRDEAK